MPSKEELETALLEIETQLAQKKIALLDVETEKTAHDLERAKRTAKRNDADADQNFTYTFYGAVASHSAGECIRQLGKWHRIDPTADLTIVFTSPGGSVLDGLGLYDFMREMSDSGHKIITKALGFAASMAGVLMQAGDHRVISKNGLFHIHEIQAQNYGGTTERDEQEKFVKRLEDIILGILAEKSTFSKVQLRNRWKKNNVWFSADEALEHGFVDEIV